MRRDALGAEHVRSHIMRNIVLRRTALSIIPIPAVAHLLPAGGSIGSPTDVQITLSEFKIDSAQTTFATGTPYRFVIKSEGTIPHNWAIMPRGETDESQTLVRVDESQLPPGTTVAWDLTFTQVGDFESACHLPGHCEAGMLLPSTVR
jgi:uncharacterized cupredoxin-like copper-binding protein